MTAVFAPPHLDTDAVVDGLRRSPGWTVVQLDRPRHDDADQIVVTPASVLAVTSRWYDASVVVGPVQARNDRAAALTAARRLRARLRAIEVSEPCVVTPVLMVSGPGAVELPNGHCVVDGAYIVDGENPYLWRHRFSSPVISARTRFEIVTSLGRPAPKRRLLSLV